MGWVPRPESDAERSYVSRGREGKTMKTKTGMVVLSDVGGCEGSGDRKGRPEGERRSLYFTGSNRRTPDSGISALTRA